MIKTRIGLALRNDSRRAVFACLIAVATILIDFGFGSKHVGSPVRLTYTVLSILALLVLSRGDYASLGLHFKPKQGYKYWLVVTAVIGAGLGIVMLLFYGTLSLLGIPTRSVGTPPQLNVFLAWLWQMCVLGPLYEEPIYRLALATGLRAVLPSWAVILIGGVTFAVLHFLYGIADITNALAGFVLTWAFLQSESILVPILLHLLGNIVVVIIWVVSWSLIK